MRGQQVDVKVHRRLTQLVRPAMPERLPHVYDLQLMEPANLIDAFFAQEEQRIALSRDQRPTPVPVFLFEVDPSAHLWRYQFILLPVMQPLRTAHPAIARRVMMLDQERLLTIYEVMLPASERLPSPEAVAMRMYVESLQDARTAQPWERLPQEEREGRVAQVVAEVMPALAAKAQERWPV